MLSDYGIYEDDILPFIVSQINQTASTFYYDLRTRNKDLRERGLPPETKKASNVIVGKKEIGGVCRDYASHFIDNYLGPGDVYYVSVDVDGSAKLLQRIKPFEKTDIKVELKMSADDFQVNLYQRVISSEANVEGAYFIWEDENEIWQTFYTDTKDSVIHWSEEPFTDNTKRTPFKKQHIKVDKAKLIEEQNKQIQTKTENYYKNIIKEHREYDKQGATWRWSGVEGYSSELGDWKIDYIRLASSIDGSLYLCDDVAIPTPLSHAGETDKSMFSDHAWVRIILKNMTIDVDPTWYDNGMPIEWGAVEIVKAGVVTTYPNAYELYTQLPNTKLISPVTGRLKAGSKQKFVIVSSDYSDFTLIHDDEWHDFTFNEDNRNFELDFVIPNNAIEIDIYCVTSKNSKRSAQSIVGFKVEK